MNDLLAVSTFLSGLLVATAIVLARNEDGHDNP
jgi:hypothetical protein